MHEFVHFFSQYPLVSYILVFCAGFFVINLGRKIWQAKKAGKTIDQNELTEIVHEDVSDLGNVLSGIQTVASLVATSKSAIVNQAIEVATQANSITSLASSLETDIKDPVIQPEPAKIELEPVAPKSKPVHNPYV